MRPPSSRRSSGSVRSSLALRLEDRSDSLGSFARGVCAAPTALNSAEASSTIPSFHVVGTAASSYVAYRVVIVTRESSSISILRRYSDFVALRSGSVTSDVLRRSRAVAS